MPLPPSTIAFLSTTFFVVTFVFCFSLFWEKSLCPSPHLFGAELCHCNSILQEENNCLVPSPLYMYTYIWMENFRFTSTLLWKKKFGKSKRNPQSYIILLECTFASIFPQNVPGKPPPLPTPTYVNSLPPLCAEIGLHLCSKRWTSFWIPHWQCNFFSVFFFFAILLRFEWVTKYDGWFVSFRFVAAK